jgi:predicted Na+-dependent transporter
VFGSLAFEWTAASSEVKEVAVVAHVAFTQGDADDPTVRVTGSAAFSWYGLAYFASHIITGARAKARCLLITHAEASLSLSLSLSRYLPPHQRDAC